MPDGRGRPTSRRFGYSVVSSPLHDPVAVARLTAPARACLDELGGHPEAVDAGADRPHLYLVATGGTERALIGLVEQRQRAAPGEPVILLAHGGHNSLPAALEALAALRRAARRGRIAFLRGDGSDRQAAAEAVGELETTHRFRAARLGVVGGPSDWLVASCPRAEVVRRRWGPQIEILETGELARRAVRVAPPRAYELAARNRPQDAPERVTVSDDDVEQAAAVGVALADQVSSAGVDAVTVRCFDLLSEPGTSGCLALASLNDAGTVAGCEGDVPATLAMMLVRFLLDEPAWMANPARIDIDRNRVVLAHCTVATSMTEGFSLATHFESGIGVGISGRFAQQPVTVLRIGGDDLDERWIAEGRIVANGTEPDLCRTQVTVELEDRTVTELLDRPLGNHLTLVAGRHATRLERWWRLAIAPDGGVAAER